MFLEVYIRSDPRLESLPSVLLILSNHKYAVRRALLKRNFYMLVKLVLISDTYCILIKRAVTSLPTIPFIREEFMTRVSCHVTIFSQVSRSDAWRVQSQLGPWSMEVPQGQFVPFSGGSNRGIAIISMQ